MLCSTTPTTLSPLHKPNHLPTAAKPRVFFERTKTLQLHQTRTHKRIQPSNPRSPSPFHPPPATIVCCSTPNHHSNPQNTTSALQSWAERLAVLVFGSVVLVGSFRFRPSMAVFRANLEERIGVRNGGGGEGRLKANSGDLEALKMEFYGKMRKGKTMEAVEYVEKMIDVEPDEVEWRLLQALCYELMGRLGKAKMLFMDILEERPLLIRALHGLALVMHKSHEGSAVFEMLNKALELARQEERVTEERNIQILIAQMHVVEGDLEGGLKRFQELVNENPRDFRPFLCQGIIYSLLDKKEEANEQFEIYRSLVPEEFPQRGFLDDVVLTASTQSREKLKKEFESEFSNKK